MDSTPGSKMDLYARAAATLYGIISFDNFCKILDVYYGEGTLSRKRIMAYFWTSDNDDPIYYIQDELIVHASIFPDEIASTLSDIQRSKLAPASRCYRVLPQKEFLRYANPFFYEDTCGTRQMEEFLTDNLGISRERCGGDRSGDGLCLPLRRQSHPCPGCPHPAGPPFWPGMLSRPHHHRMRDGAGDQALGGAWVHRK